MPASLSELSQEVHQAVGWSLGAAAVVFAGLAYLLVTEPLLAAIAAAFGAYQVSRTPPPEVGPPA